MKLTRRAFIGTTAAASLSAPLVNAGGHGRPKVVVIGGVAEVRLLEMGGQDVLLSISDEVDSVVAFAVVR